MPLEDLIAGFCAVATAPASGAAGGITAYPGDFGGVEVVPHAQVAAVLAMPREIDQRDLEQARLIVASGSRRGGLAKHGRI